MTIEEVVQLIYERQEVVQLIYERQEWRGDSDYATPPSPKNNPHCFFL